MTMRILLSAVRSEHKLTEILLDEQLRPIKQSKTCYESEAPQNTVESIASLQYDGQRYVAIGRHSGLIEIFKDDKATTGNDPETPVAVLYDNIWHGRSDTIITIRQVQKYIIVASNRGLISIYSIDQILQNENVSSFSMRVSDPLEFCINFPDNPFKVIVGGYDTSLAIFEFSKEYHDFVAQFRVKENTLKVCKWIVSLKCSWKGSKIGDDFIWFKDCVVLQDAAFGNNDGDNITLYGASKFGMLFKFKPYLTPVCVNKILVSNYSLRSIMKVNNNFLMLLDSFNSVFIYDTFKEEVVKKYTVPLIGSISGIELVSLDSKGGRYMLVVSSGDGKLRIYMFHLADMSLKLMSCSNIGTIVPAVKVITGDDFSNIHLGFLKDMRSL